MRTVRDLLATLDSLAPFATAFPWDKVGLQVGDPDSTCERVLVTLDRSLDAVRHAVEIGAHVVVSHHPLLFRPLESVLETDHVGRTVRELVRHDIALIAAHTNWDVAVGGVNDALANRLGLENVTPFGADPFPAGRIGVWSPCSPAEARDRLAGILATPVELWASDDRPVARVAVVGGAASGEWSAALANGADLFVTGEIPQHVAVEATESGVAIAAAGHYATEQPGMIALRDLLDNHGWNATLHQPAPGRSGRPFS